MDPKRTLLVAAASVVGSAAALVSSPGAYTWLRRRVGRRTAERPLEREDVATPSARVTGDPDPRRSLRERLAEEARVSSGGPDSPIAPAPPREADDRLRATVDETRARARAKAAGLFDSSTGEGVRRTYGVER